MLHQFVTNTRFRILAIWSGWGIWYAIILFQNYITTNPPDIFRDRIIEYGMLGVFWALITPLVFFLAKRIPYENNFARVFLLHFLIASVILLIRSALMTIVFMQASRTGALFFPTWRVLVTNYLAGSYFLYAQIVTIHYSVVWFTRFKNSQLNSFNLQLKSEQLERQLTESNLLALRMQLNPHFLFNALNSVSSLIRIKRNDDAVNTLSTLGELLRSTVYENTKSEVTIREEVLFIKRYLTIEELRFSDRLQVSWNVDESVLDQKIPTFLLQPLVENALKHGLKDAKNGKLNISVKATGNNHVTLLVEDNGVGLQQEPILEKFAGVGIKNTVDRLKGTYGDKFEFNIANNSAGPGVQVKLVLPTDTKS